MHQIEQPCAQLHLLSGWFPRATPSAKIWGAMNIICGWCKGRHKSVALVRDCYQSGRPRRSRAPVLPTLRPYEDHLMEVLENEWSPESPPDKWRQFHHPNDCGANQDGDAPEWNYEERDRDQDREPPDWDDMD